jgi:type II secretion system protein J
VAKALDGFTLLEILLALGVSAIVLAAIGGVFFSALRLRERTAAMLDETLPLHQALLTMRRDLQGALPPGGVYAMAGDFRDEVAGGLGANNRLTFFTTTGKMNDNDPWGDTQQVSYELRDPVQRTNGTGRDLIRSVNRNVLATGLVEMDDQWLMGNVQSLAFQCYDGYNWRDSWDTSLGDTNLPLAIRVRIQLGSESIDPRNPPEPYELLVPLVTQSRTNQVVSTGGTQ